MLNVFILVYFASSTILLLSSTRCKLLKEWSLHGKHRKDREIKCTLISKNKFIHFYCTGLFFNTIFILRESNLNVYRLLFEVHLIRRFLEELLMFNSLAKQSYMHVTAYIFGISYYMIVPLSLFGALTLNLNCSIAIVLLNISIQLIQFACHCKLYRLRRSNVYALPTGGLFNFIKCPHYLMEVSLLSIPIYRDDNLGEEE